MAMNRDQEKAMFAKMGGRSTRDSSPQFSNKPKGFFQRLKESRLKKQEKQKIERIEAEEKQIKREALELKAQAEQETRLQRLENIREAKEKIRLEKEQIKEKLAKQKQEEFARSKTGRLIAAGKQIGARLAAEAKKKPKGRKGKKEPPLRFI